MWVQPDGPHLCSGVEVLGRRGCGGCWANELAKRTYNFYLKTITMKMAAAEFPFPSDAPKALLSEETLVAVRRGAITQQILEGVRRGEITRKMIRDEMVKGVLEVRSILTS
ncbi:hypothetical protein M0R45_038161 [Rubus argutus]|uniref:Uncharacterized protein n=1 Tax=Rubus argutus TaxID=59490 RepID=A0AAW1W6A2_RUBAR